MKINKRTKTKKILPFLTKEISEQLLELVPEVPLDKQIMDMTIEEFSEVILDEEAFIMKLLNEKYVFNAFGKLKSFRRQMNELTKFIKLYEVKQSNEEKQAASGIVFPDLIARMLLTVTKFLSLHSIEEAKYVLVQEYLMIFQEEASSLMYQRAYSNIIHQQMKIKDKNKRK